MLTQFFNEKGSAISTQKHYRASVKLYESITGLTLTELLTEADDEENQMIPWKRRSLKEHLIDFRNYLYAHKSEGTAKQYLNDVQTLYRHYEIELHPLPSFNSKQIDKTYEKKFSDILTKNELIDAYHEANNVCKCIILFASSSGFSKIDLLNLTVSDFVNACDRYITQHELCYQLRELKDKVVFAEFEGTRQKTETSFTTFCSPEAAEHIIQYLLGRDAQIRKDYADAEDKTGLSEKLEYSDKLFDVSYATLQRNFNRINQKLGLGKVGHFNKFRCHQLRTYHASTLLNSKCNLFSEQEIDTLQGRKRSMTHRAYLVDSKTKLFDKYVECVDDLMLFKSIHEIDAEEFEKMEEENKELKNHIEMQSKEIAEIKLIQSRLEKLVGI